MKTPISIINWLEHNEIINDLLNQEDSLTAHTMDQGFEAEVLRINSDQESYVLKTWNKESDRMSSFNIVYWMFYPNEE